MEEKKTIGYNAGIIEVFRTKLLGEQMKCMARIQRNGQPIFVEEFWGAEKGDRSQVAERHVAQAIGDQSYLNDIKKSLQRIEEGTYGFCLGCQTLILLARLDAFPTASRCVPCQAKHDKSKSRK